MPERLHTRACAKVNLTLEVRGKRADGYHELHTLFDELAIHDDLSFERADAGGFELQMHGGRADVPRGADNLVLRAAYHLAEAWSLAFGGRFTLEKRLPSGAGLGGGSSDAAAALRLVARAAGRDPAHPEVASDLEEIGRSLGADVAFFVRGGRAFARGRGDEPETMSSDPALHYALLLPDQHCETAAVFSQWHRELNDSGSEIGSSAKDRHGERASHRDPRQLVQQLPQMQGPEGRIRGLFNDLTAAAMHAYPVLGVLHAEILREGFTDLQLSGSGSTFFVVSHEREPIERAARGLEEIVTRLRRDGFEGLGPDARVILTESRGM